MPARARADVNNITLQDSEDSEDSEDSLLAMDQHIDDHQVDESVEQTDTDTEFDVPIVSVGDKFNYNVPSFPPFSAMLRHMRYQFTEEDGTVFLLDGFIRDCTMLDRTYSSFCFNGKRVS